MKKNKIGGTKLTMEEAAYRRDISNKRDIDEMADKAAVKQMMWELYERAGDYGLTDAEQELQEKLSAIWKHQRLKGIW